MNTEHHVVILELAKELKEAGYPQDTIFWWQHEGVKPHIVIDTTGSYKDVCIAAPLASELGEQLPGEIEVPGLHYHGDHEENTFCLDMGKSDISYTNGEECLKIFEDGTEANGRAKMWLYLKKEGLL